jgi:septal ring factor EnvC (AmiA/AmiB activator)
MSQTPSPQPPNYNEMMVALSPVMRQLERLDERTQNLATRADLESLRKELVARDSLEPQLAALRAQIARVETDQAEDKKALEKRIDDLEKERVSNSERLWSKIGIAIAALAFLLALLQFLPRLSFH